MNIFGRNSIKRVLKILLCICLSWVFLRNVPVGIRTYEWVKPADNISLSEPRYLVPRELIFSTKEMRFRPDPHFSASSPMHFLASSPEGPTRVIAQGFAINPSFKNRDLHKDVLAVQINKQIYKFIADDTCFSCWTGSRQLVFLGQTRDSLTFLVITPDAQGKRVIGVLTVSWPLVKNSRARLSLEGTSEFENEIQAVKEFGVAEHHLTEICNVRKKPFNLFIKENYNWGCEVPRASQTQKKKM